MSDDEYPYDEVREAARQLAQVAAPMWRMGDGCGGYVVQVLFEEFAAIGLIEDPAARRKPLTPGEKMRQALTRDRVLQARVMARDGVQCLQCGDDGDLTIDHITPVSKGGTNDIENLRTLCRSCNSRKGAKV